MSSNNFKLTSQQSIENQFSNDICKGQNSGRYFGSRIWNLSQLGFSSASKIKVCT